jgi:hypothetical protein
MRISENLGGILHNRLAQSCHARPQPQRPQLAQHVIQQTPPGQHYACLVLTHPQTPATGKHPPFRIHHG